MPTFVALLRGINVGKAKRIPMAELREMLGEVGYTGVATLLNSGNAVFQVSKGTSAKHASEISAAITSKFQIEVPVIVKSAKELAAIATENPFAKDAADHSRLLIAFVQDAKSLAGLKPLQHVAVPPEEFVIGKHAAYLHCVSGILESKVGKALLGKEGKSTTTRNWATVLKLLTLAGETATGV
ncbi:MAG TPA: DUF1697 domain-containing protein [Schlesneria sp.]|jgi:uncharacterized protein (DUF1697 family)